MIRTSLAILLSIFLFLSPVKAQEFEFEQAVHEVIQDISREMNIPVESIPNPFILMIPKVTLNQMYYRQSFKRGSTALAVRGVYTENVIFLPTDFNLKYNKWVLYHEMVHHFQEYNPHRTYECTGEREIEAYQMTDAWGKRTSNIYVASDPLTLLMYSCDDVRRGGAR